MNHEKQTKHTPGPWKVYNNVGRKGEIGVIAEAAPCVIASGFSEKYWPGIASANAELIASAPELLEALQFLLDCPDLNLDGLEDETVKAIELAENAIKKAKGLQQ